MKQLVEFSTKDALAFADAYRFGLRLSAESLNDEIEAQSRSNSLGPAGLKGLEAARIFQRTQAMPALVRFEIEVPTQDLRGTPAPN